MALQSIATENFANSCRRLLGGKQQVRHWQWRLGEIINIDITVSYPNYKYSYFVHFVAFNIELTTYDSCHVMACSAIHDKVHKDVLRS
jgi:hypothetical protein